MVLEENGEDKNCLQRIEEKRTLPNNILRIKVNWVGHILRRNSLLHEEIEGQMTEVKGIGRRRRRKQLLADLLNRKIYWGIKGKNLKIEKDENDSLSHEYEKEIQFIFLKSMDRLISNILNNNSNNNSE